MISHFQEVPKIWRSISCCVLLHLCIFAGAYFFYGHGPQFVIQLEDKTLPALQVKNLCGLTVCSGLLGLVLFPAFLQIFEKKKNDKILDNIECNLWNSLATCPFVWVTFDWLFANRVYISKPGMSEFDVADWFRILAESVCYIMIADFWFFATHYVAHNHPFLWRHHVVHHMLNPAKSVTAIAAASTSWIDLYLTHLPMVVFPFMFFKYDFFTISISILFMMFWTPFIHSGSFVNFDMVLIMGPMNHRVHHSWGKRNNYNYAAFTTIYDRMFGTYKSPAQMALVKEEMAHAD